MDRAGFEERLRLAGRGIDYPTTPDLEASVMAALPVARSRPRRFSRAVAVAVCAAVVVAVFAFPGPRRAVADLLGIGGVAITMVDDLPEAEVTADPWGSEVSFDEAQDAADFDLLLPGGVGDPDAVFVDRTVPGTLVTLAYGRGADGYRLVITEMLGSADPIVHKEVPAGTTVEGATVGSAPGFWIHGTPHVVLLEIGPESMRRDLPRIVGNTLVYVRDGITIRIETAGTLEQTLEVADSLR